MSFMFMFIFSPFLDFLIVFSFWPCGGTAYKIDQGQSVYLPVQRFERTIRIGPWPVIGFQLTAPSLFLSLEAVSWSQFPKKWVWAGQADGLIDLLNYL